MLRVALANIHTYLFSQLRKVRTGSEETEGDTITHTTGPSEIAGHREVNTQALCG